MLLKNYEEQHANVRSEIALLDELIKKANIEEKAFEIATHVSRLAGILKIHLDSEDKYLYPSLEKSSDAAVREMTTKYHREMGNLLAEFVVFKEKYNTKQKLLANQATLKGDYTKMVNALTTRMKKEEQGIYQHLS